MKLFDDDMDDVFHALSAPVRRKILDALREAPGSTVGAVSACFPISRMAVQKHLARLERANLVLSERVGRERRLYVNVVPLEAIAQRWMDRCTRRTASGLLDLKRTAEADHMEEQDEARTA